MYSTKDEVIGMVKPDVMNSIIGNEYIESIEERKSKLTSLVETAILDADGEIDGYLAKRYPLPLSTVPRVINKFSKDIALYNLFSRNGLDDGDRESNYLTRYKAAIRFLENVSKGIVDIGATKIETRADTGFNLKSSIRRFNRNSLKGM